MYSTGNPQLQLAFDFVQFTNKNIFLTGKAGTGKTTFLHNLKKLSPKRMVVVAPTGVAAINAGGVTIHSFFQVPFGPQIPSDRRPEPASTNNIKKLNREKINIIHNLDLLVIDEISMVRADLLDSIDDILRRFKDRNLPFGGVQLLMIGDLQQLAPVVKEEEWQILRDYYSSPFFFSSNSLNQTDYVSIELKQVYRQTDKLFIELLNKVRDNRLDPVALLELNKRYIPGFLEKEHEGFIILTTHNNQARQVNENKLKKLAGQTRSFKAIIENDFPEYSYPTEPLLTLKKGAQVMFLKNDSSPEKLFFNGKIGIVSKIEEEVVYVKCPGDEQEIVVEKTSWHNTKYSINQETKEIQETIIGKFTQYPLKLAWAITIHKSQGLTFEEAVIDANAAFAHGQVYVALSRCKTLEGMVLSTPLSEGAFINNLAVSKFNQDVENNQPGVNQLAGAKKEYQLQMLRELFNFNSIQRRLYYLVKIFNENQSILAGNKPIELSELSVFSRTEIINVSEKFEKQIISLAQGDNDLENNNILQGRVKKASGYFLDKLENKIITFIENFVVETDNKKVKKTIMEVINHLGEDVKIKIACLRVAQEGFLVKTYLNTKAKTYLDNPAKSQEKEKNDTPVTPPESKYPELYERLKSWRNMKASELGLPHFMILQVKTMVELSSFLPSSKILLKKINGMGKKKVENYGTELLDIIIKYSQEKGLSLYSEENFKQENETSIKEERKNTRQVSFELFLSGKNLKEIAAARNLAQSTVEGHLAHYVATGDIEVEKLVEVEKISIITDFFLSKNNYSLKEAKNMLGEKITYGDLKLVVKHLEYKKMLNISG
ncbi:MAG: helix-turn-helix domain-containing protein [Bacteroidota bacterium]